jgi:uncharacterized damage-inducible protein DinB
MDPQCVPIHTIAELNSRLFANCLEGMNDMLVPGRISDDTSSFLFVASHLVDARAYIVSLIGGEVSNRLVEHLRSVETVESLPDPPGLDDLRSAWMSLSEELLRQIPALTQANLRLTSPDPMPVADPSMLGALTFLLQHESYHVGQLAMLKKHLTGNPMKYSSRGGK